LSAKVLDGRLKGDLSFLLVREQEYSAKLEFVDLDLATFIRDFDLSKKYELTGRLCGTATLKGRGRSLRILDGNFSAAQEGGLLVIKDTRFLENMARRSGQSLDILMESFKDYKYNTGIMQLSLERDNLVFNIVLDGNSGKRNLSITLHDFSLISEGMTYGTK